LLRFWLNAVLDRNYGAYIGKGADIAPDVQFAHKLHGIFIADRASIGSGTRIYQHVTIGAKRDRDNRKQAPQIGRNVLIGANATIVGRCRIGDGAKIGAGVTIVDAVVPDHAVIINKSAYDLTNQRYIYPQ
jgi:serine O-acetyltransferase